MTIHDKAYKIQQRERVIKKWKRWSYRVMGDRYWSEFWEQEGRFNKFSLSCDCSMCRIARDERKFRNKKKKIYREMDKVDELV